MSKIGGAVSEHTPEPWVVDQPYIKNATDELTADWVIAESWRDYGIDAQWANARRIVACVNACKDIPTEVLEHESTNVTMVARASSAAWDGFLRERDERIRKLEEALRHAIKVAESYIHDEYDGTGSVGERLAELDPDRAALGEG